MKTKSRLLNLLIGVPLGAIIGTSFLPLRAVVSQAMVFFTIIWFYTFIMFEIFTK